MPKPGELLAGRYRVERTLGSGGMGLVLAAHDEETGDHVAVAHERRGFANSGPRPPRAVGCL